MTRSNHVENVQLYMLSGVADCERARSQPSVAAKWPRRRDGALVASLSGKILRGHEPMTYPPEPVFSTAVLDLVFGITISFE